MSQEVMVSLWVRVTDRCCAGTCVMNVTDNTEASSENATGRDSLSSGSL